MSDFIKFINNATASLGEGSIITGAIVGITYIDPHDGHPMIYTSAMDDTTFVDMNAMANILAGDAYSEGKKEA